MQDKTFFGLCTTLTCAVSIIAPSEIEAKNKPNIIFILADDLGWGDVGFNGNKIIATPHMDALASDGLIFDRFYSSSAVSSPTRFSVLTGRNPYRSGVFGANQGLLREEEYTISELLKNVGYKTGHFGKWHLGSLTDKEKDSNNGNVGATELFNPPSRHHFDESFVSEAKVPTYDPMFKPTNSNNIFWDHLEKGEERVPFGTSYWHHDGTKATKNLDGDDSRIIMDRVLPFIDDAKNTGNPFLSLIWFHAPHTPCVAGPEYAKMYSDFTKKERNYYGCITAMDEQIGRLVKHLKENDLYDNTLIFFCSDNGYAPIMMGSSGGLRAQKFSLYEGGIRVPAFAVWPKTIKADSHTKAPAFVSDYLPTIADIISKKASPYALDGESIYRVLKGQEVKRKPMIFLYKDQMAVIDCDYKLYYSTQKGYELYNLANDRAEQKSILENEPEIAEKLKKVLEKHIDDYKSTFLGNEYKGKFESKIIQKWPYDE